MESGWDGLRLALVMLIGWGIFVPRRIYLHHCSILMSTLWIVKLRVAKHNSMADSPVYLVNARV